METVLALSKLAAPCSGVKMILRYLEVKGYRYAIATTSPKPRVPVCVDTAGLRPWFPEDKIHSGESDFNPPRFKPDPAVYQKAAKSESVSVQNSIAVEDSLSGVGSAANAKIGLIVGYVGATHISSENKDAHALSLLGGGKSKKWPWCRCSHRKYGRLGCPGRRLPRYCHERRADRAPECRCEGAS